MINTIDTLGLKVNTITPDTYSNNIDINTEITITFNSELNKDLISSGILIYEDVNRKYSRNSRIKEDEYDYITYSLRYSNKTVSIRPNIPLKENCRYIIFIDRRVLQDILGNMMTDDFISYFDTTGDSYNICRILKPANNSIIPVLDSILLEDTYSDRYNIQISRSRDFNTVVYDEIIDGIAINKVYPLPDGMYYLRAKEENAPVYSGEPIIFSIKSYQSTTVTDQDVDEEYMFRPIEEEELLVTGSFPENEGCLVNVKSNVTYMKFNKLIDIDDIDFYESYFTGEMVDDTDNYLSESLDKSMLSHGEVEGHYVFAQDEDNEETYVFFVPDTL